MSRCERERPICPKCPICSIEEGIQDISGGIEKVNDGLDDIMEKNFCKGVTKIEKGLSCIEEGLKDIIAGVKCSEFRMRCKKEREFCDAICDITEGTKDCKEALKDICKNKICEGVKCIEDCLFDISEGLEDILRLLEMNVDCNRRPGCSNCQ